MCLSLEILTSIIRTGKPILVKLKDLLNSYNFSISNDLTEIIHFPTRILDCDSQRPVDLDFIVFSDASNYTTMFFSPF